MEIAQDEAVVLVDLAAVEILVALDRQPLVAEVEGEAVS